MLIKKLFANNREFFLFFVILFWYIASIQFYQYVGFPNAGKIKNIISIVSAALFIYYIGDVLNAKKYGPVSCIAIGTFLSYLISLILWGASPYYSILAQTSSVGMLYVIVFFVLRRWKVNIITVHYVLISLAIIYLICWLYSLYKIPELVFGIDRDGEYGEISERGFYRLFIPGNISALLTFFFLSKFLQQKKMWGLVLTGVMFVITILHVGRQVILWTFFFSAIMVFTHFRKHFFYLICAVIVGYLALMLVVSEIPAVSVMMEFSEMQADNAEEDIRVEAINYFVYDYPHNLITNIWGNGVPTAYSDLGLINAKAMSRGYFLEDIGFFAMYCNYGFWGVFFHILLLWRIILLRIEQRYEYLKFFIYFEYGVYLFSQSLTAAFFPVMMAYYVLEESARKKSALEVYR